jgi:NAD(P)-dependent dehydrogenase (short-subunit alcohol dehydrogenase family)
MKATDLFNVEGHVAFVTGAASGLGLAMAEVMADNGARVVMTDINPDTLAAESRRLADAGGSVEAVELDVADLPALRAAIDQAAAAHGRLDAVFANAGISAGPGYRTEAGRIDAVDPAKWDEVVHVNLTSVFATVQAAARHMKQQRAGRIVVTSSIAGLKSEHMVGYGYAATKAAVINLVRQAAMELAPYGVSINAIAPGPFFTNIGNGRLSDPEVVKGFTDIVPMGRIADTSELQGLALLLGSPASSFITGAAIPIDGGCTAG